jgi:hypothetical protein
MSLNTSIKQVYAIHRFVWMDSISSIDKIRSARSSSTQRFASCISSSNASRILSAVVIGCVGGSLS